MSDLVDPTKLAEACDALLVAFLKGEGAPVSALAQFTRLARCLRDAWLANDIEPGKAPRLVVPLDRWNEPT